MRDIFLILLGLIIMAMGSKIITGKDLIAVMLGTAFLALGAGAIALVIFSLAGFA